MVVRGYLNYPLWWSTNVFEGNLIIKTVVVVKALKALLLDLLTVRIDPAGSISHHFCIRRTACDRSTNKRPLWQLVDNRLKYRKRRIDDTKAGFENAVDAIRNNTVAEIRIVQCRNSIDTDSGENTDPNRQLEVEREISQGINRHLQGTHSKYSAQCQFLLRCHLELPEHWHGK